jgi:hypothetical protein
MACAAHRMKAVAMMTLSPDVRARAVSQSQYILTVATERRVCSCLCPVAGHGSATSGIAICQGFIERGQPLILERVGSRHSARCLQCAEASGYTGGSAPRA